MTSWETVIGLEIHAQLATASKLFSATGTGFGAAPNEQANEIDLGLPGVLPVLNREALRMAALFGLAVGAEVAHKSVFARKNYFYPDLPKGYQISQYELPIVSGGSMLIDLPDGGELRVGITRAHLEEDAGKSLHEDFQGMTGIDLNRAGTPLLEIVSEPDLRSSQQAVAYMRKIHSLVRYLGICDGNMQEGSFRADANVSIRPAGQTTLGTRTELKNINSFRFVEKAIEFEVERQIELLESGGEVVQETRLYDPDSDQTRSMRSKEEANDYRYFPDPDLLPVVLDDNFLTAMQSQLPELPDAKKQRFVEHYQLRTEDAEQLTISRELADYFETVTNALSDASDPEPEGARLAANWVTGELAAALNRDGSSDVAASPVSAVQLAGLLRRVADDTISTKTAKVVFEELWQQPSDDPAAADAVIERDGLRQVSDSAAIEAAVDAVLAANPDQVSQFRAGRTKVKGFFVGQLMKQFQGQVNPQQLNQLLEQKLHSNDNEK